MTNQEANTITNELTAYYGKDARVITSMIFREFMLKYQYNDFMKAVKEYMGKYSHNTVPSISTLKPLLPDVGDEIVLNSKQQREMALWAINGKIHEIRQLKELIAQNNFRDKPDQEANKLLNNEIQTILFAIEGIANKHNIKVKGLN